MPKRTTSYREMLLEDLQDPQEAAHYLNAVIEDRSERLFLLALRDIAESRQMAKVAEAAGGQRETIYRMLSETGNPRLSSLWDLFPALGLRIRFDPIIETHGRQREPSAIDEAIRKALGQRNPEAEPRGITNIAGWNMEHQQMRRGQGALEQAGALLRKPAQSSSALDSAAYVAQGA